MKTKLLSMFILISVSLNIFADSFIVGNLKYSITNNNDEVGVVQNLNKEVNYPGLKSIVIPATITYQGEKYKVTRIYADAFKDCPDLEILEIGENITNINYRAIDSPKLSTIIWQAKKCEGWENGSPFYESLQSGRRGSHDKITSITFTDKVESIPSFLCAFMSSLTSITIPNSVTSIGISAFRECSGLTSITIPNSVTSIGNSAFYNCSSLPVIDNIRYADTYLVSAIGNRNSYKIKEGTRFIGNSAFAYCSNLTSITIPNSVTSIGNSAFYYCDDLTSITIPNSVTSIGNFAFYWCNALPSITIPNSVTSIGDNAFQDCTAV